PADASPAVKIRSVSKNCGQVATSMSEGIISPVAQPISASSGRSVFWDLEYGIWDFEVRVGPLGLPASPDGFLVSTNHNWYFITTSSPLPCPAGQSRFRRCHRTLPARSTPCHVLPAAPRPCRHLQPDRRAPRVSRAHAQ